ncbi:hypothetical protein RJ639_025756, partial [Escallonia herrerae]
MTTPAMKKVNLCYYRRLLLNQRLNIKALMVPLIDGVCGTSSLIMDLRNIPKPVLLENLGKESIEIGEMHGLLNGLLGAERENLFPLQAFGDSSTAISNFNNQKISPSLVERVDDLSSKLIEDCWMDKYDPSKVIDTKKTIMPMVMELSDNSKFRKWIDTGINELCSGRLERMIIKSSKTRDGPEFENLTSKGDSAVNPGLQHPEDGIYEKVKYRTFKADTREDLLPEIRSWLSARESDSFTLLDLLRAITGKIFKLSIMLIRAPILSSHRLTQIMATNTTVVNSDNTVSNTTVVQFNPASQLPIKLAGSHNFTTWKAQVSMLMHGHNLFGHLDGTLAAPPTTLTENNQSTPNPAYQIWFRQDQLVQNAILASVEPTLASTVAIAPSAHKAWTSLHTAFANKSQTRIISLQDQLARITKDSRPVTDYLRDIRSIADELATAGAAITNVQLIVRILQGLGSEYKAISAAIRSRETTISYEE